MNWMESLVAEFDQECVTTRKYLASAPEEKFGWKPHEKSMSLGTLVSHLAENPRWAVTTLTTEVFDYNPVDGEKMEFFQTDKLEEALKRFDEGVEKARQAISQAKEEDLDVLWTMQDGGKTVLAMPRWAVLRSFVLSHSTHHRAQLGVYLRLLDVPVPSAYGPTADDASS